MKGRKRIGKRLNKGETTEGKQEMERYWRNEEGKSF